MLGNVTGVAVAQEISIGAVVPLSGASATTGEDQRRGITLAVEEINAQGGVLGQPFSVIIEDSGGRPQSAIDAATKLVTVDEVPIVIGEYSSGNTLPMGDYLVQQGVPHINPASTSGQVRDIGETSYSVVGLDNVSTAFAAQDVLDQGWERVAVIAVNNAFGQGVAEEFGKHFTELGGEVTTSILYNQGQSTYRRELQQLAAGEPDAIVYTAYGTEAALINQEAFELGMQDQFPFYSILITMMNSDTEPQFKVGQMGMDVGYVGENGESYREAYTTAFGEDFLSAYGGYAHDAVLFAAAAIERAGSTDREAILEAIEALGEEGFEGITGMINFDEDGQRTAQPYLKFIVNDDALDIRE
ncbi:extracellular ligand-binding receptor [Pelagibacterium halotolerans B2]|uniref:Extracellular ligand-binding receptor n=2 Tax=Pelagibacterium TaxID=1082930 RepID=G4R6F9_PELHB|nr:extracellular ligand-binding receptor [Pelagibacterium halotolerans B2]